MGSSLVDVKASGQTLWRLNAMPKYALGVWILRLNGQDQMVRSGNYCCSSIRVVYIDENKNIHRKITMTHTQTTWFHLKLTLCHIFLVAAEFGKTIQNIPKMFPLSLIYIYIYIYI